jgi:hypothetical protein
LSSLDELIFSAKKLISEGNYLQAVREYGSVLEIVLRRLYREYFPQLPFTDKEKAISFEKRQGKSADGFTIGEWIGLFREARLLDFIAERKNIKKPLFFTFSLLDILNKLRNKATHPDEVDELKKYDMKVIASFMASGVECLLHELGIKVSTPTAEVPVSLVPSRGMFSKVKREDILIRMSSLLTLENIPRDGTSETGTSAVGVETLMPNSWSKHSTPDAMNEAITFMSYFFSSSTSSGCVALFLNLFRISRRLKVKNRGFLMFFRSAIKSSRRASRNKPIHSPMVNPSADLPCLFSKLIAFSLSVNGNCGKYSRYNLLKTISKTLPYSLTACK